MSHNELSAPCATLKKKKTSRDSAFYQLYIDTNVNTTEQHEENKHICNKKDSINTDMNQSDHTFKYINHNFCTFLQK